MSLIGIIGAGVIGEMVVRSYLAMGEEENSLLVCDHKEERLEYLRDTYGVQTTLSNEDVAKKCDTLVLAVKPQNLDEVVERCAEYFHVAKKLLISVLAGVTTQKLEQLFPGGTRVLRVMPNTPAQVGAGSIVIAVGKYAEEKDIEFAKGLFAAMGRTMVLPEKLMNAVTGLSGSGPAFVALIIEALADGGVAAGLPRDVATKLALDTVAGTVILLEETEMHPAQLKDQVSSPAGTTIYGLLQMEKSGARGTIMETVLAATKRAGELQ
ncbi:MAG TPA: pyrroline-5-carboxylate reductase [Peptococcaceae bacterium]|nr:pyrroline-5-carboxylate reductase [Clostridia bacterium]HPZ71919.1 pyrroline-5-carboxylate reductase [Peptococcaceae bacterium]HQD54725.1 pyrroline-5-carboxylate reductase [Peptococcaceae bacterium]